MIGVVIPVKNGWKDTEECLKSLQKSSVHLTVCVVDGGSVDGTVNLPKEFPFVAYLYDKNKTTFSAMVNFGCDYLFRFGDIDAVLILNNDTVVEHDAIANMAAQFYDKIGLITPRINYYGTKRVWSAGGALDLNWGLTWHENIRSEAPGMSNYVSWGTGCALMISKECWQATRGLDESLPWYDSDVDFALRARELGYTCYYTNKAVIEHKIGRSSPSWWQAKEKLKGRTLLLIKHVAWWRLPLAILGFLIQSLIRFIKSL